MSLSVIISVWRRPVQLSLILRELNKQAESNNIDLQVIVSDSKSGKEIDDVIMSIKNDCSYLNVIHGHTKNIIASKRNFGAELATGTHLLFLDDDCVPAENYLLNAISDIQNFNDNTILCGEIRFEPDKIKTSNYYRYRDSLHPVFSQTGYSDMNAWSFVSMNYIIPKGIILGCGLSYNENFIGYGCEDHEYGWQIVENKTRIVFSSNKIIHHEYDGSIKLYVKKIQVTARDGMFVLKKICPDIFKSNKKLRAIEWLFSRKNILGGFVRVTVFNNVFFKLALNYLDKTDNNERLYFPKLYRYVLISAYIKGMSERGTVKQSDLLNNWYI